MRILLLSFILLCSGAAAQINVNNYIFRSKQAIVDDQYPEAIELLNAVIKVHPQMHDPYFLRAIAKYNLGDYKGAENDLNKAIDIKPNFPDALMYRGISRERMLNFSEAIKDFNRALELDPFHDDVIVSKAFTKTIQEDYREAIELCNEALKINKQNERAYLCRAWCKYKIFDLEGAVADYTKAIKLNKFNAETFTKRGMVRAFQLKYNEALEDLNHALEMDSLNLHTLYQLAYVHQELEQIDTALFYYSEMIWVDPETAVAYFERADILAERGETDQAIEDYTMVIVLTGGHLLSYFNRGILYFEQGRFSAAVEDLTKAIEIYPDLAEAYYNRALAYSRMGMDGQATKDVERAKSIKSELYALDESGQRSERQKMKELARIDEDFQGSDGRFGRVQNKRINITPAPDFFVLPEKWVPDSLKNGVVYLKSLIKMAPAENRWVVMSHEGWRPDQPETKRQQLNEQLGQNPGDISVMIQQGVLFQLMENYDLALEVYDAVLEQDPENAIALLNRSYVLHKMLFLYDAYQQSVTNGSGTVVVSDEVADNYEKIAGDLQLIFNLHPDFVPAQFNLANLNAAIGNHSEAVKQYESIISNESSMQPAHFNLGLTLLYLNNKTEACEHLSTSGELGYTKAYRVIKRYCQP